MLIKRFKSFLIFSMISLFLIYCEDKRDIENAQTPKKVTSGYINEADDLKRMIDLHNQYLKNSNNKDKLLLSMGQIAMQMKIDLEEFKKKDEYKSICYLRIVKSANFGDFVSYDGYHFKKILEDYPNSQFVADAEYNLIYVIPDEYNYENLADEKNKLELFLKKYPNSHLTNEAQKRYDWIVDYLKNGGQEIVD